MKGQHSKPAMMGICPRCNREAERIPAGTSRRTGKPYKEFWACRSCRDRRSGRDLTWVSEKQWWYLRDTAPAERLFKNSKPIHIAQNRYERRAHAAETVDNVINLPGNGKVANHSPVAYRAPIQVDRWGNVVSAQETGS